MGHLVREHRFELPVIEHVQQRAGDLNPATLRPAIRHGVVLDDEFGNRNVRAHAYAHEQT